MSKFRNFRESEGTDRLLLNIDLDADLGPAFNWNVKQLFAFVVAEYKTKTNPVNQARPFYFLSSAVMSLPNDVA